MSWAAFGMGALSKLTGNLSDTYGSGNKLRDEKREEARDDYLFNERMGIQARVEGAKAAGLHPLAALGFQAGASPSAVIGADPIPYSHSESPRPAPRDPTLDRLNQANARIAEARADREELETHDAYRRYANGVHSLGSQPGNPPQTPMPTSEANLTSSAEVRPGVKIKPDEVTSGTGGRTAGVHQGFTDVELPGGMTITVPSDKVSEALEDMEMLKYGLTAYANKDRLVRAVGEFLRDRNPFRYKVESQQETDRLLRRYPPKGTFRTDRGGGGPVR